ncbi:hypothetical protein TRFO_01999 [Tritrichomonas foetus]|uniref:Uncharacterized protein n=1 Tax=Tritrichomonas foetus TaxID=1144522 RepID=A0A1J4JH34_9EUKA|nr:hypothetical protein TRFO_01999 [Tritrichomonas foetus]|eukprot:OHS96899.1 hypothetical protein TRFO_01999 [Tritrichomonas foetus]
MGRSNRNRVAVRYIRILNIDGTTKVCYELDQKTKRFHPVTQTNHSPSYSPSISPSTLISKTNRTEISEPDSPLHPTRLLGNTTLKTNNVHGIPEVTLGSINLPQNLSNHIPPQINSGCTESVQNHDPAQNSSNTRTLDGLSNSVFFALFNNLNLAANPEEIQKNNASILASASQKDAQNQTNGKSDRSFADELLNIETIGPMMNDEALFTEDVMLAGIHFGTNVDFDELNSSSINYFDNDQSEVYHDLHTFF